MAGIYTKESVAYANRCEKLDDKLFQTMISRKGCRWFKHLEKQVANSKIDWYATGHSHSTFAIELKSRHLKPHYLDVMIEVDKYNAMIASDKEKAYYINFLFDSPDHVIVCNLRDINISDMRLQKNVWIQPKGGQGYYGDRYFIPISQFNYYIYASDDIGYIRGADDELIEYVKGIAYNLLYLKHSNIKPNNYG